MMRGLQTKTGKVSGWRRRESVGLNNSGRKGSRRQPAEESPRQPAAVVEDDPQLADAEGLLAIWNHSTL
jgi:hypothetical protein